MNSSDTEKQEKHLWHSSPNTAFGYNISLCALILPQIFYTQNPIMVEELALGIVEAAKMMANEEMTLDLNREYTTVKYITCKDCYRFSHGSLKNCSPTNIVDVMNDLTAKGFVKRETEKVLALFHEFNRNGHFSTLVIFSRLRE